ncbi:TPA: glycosyltransferase, partial [Candidatus Bathyarchaeota archaeon]|nr:glycosyltransferase [Candidatus Bathyarchaeota archaeon]
MPKPSISALAKGLERRLERIKEADLLIGIPSYNCASTINYVIHKSALGLSKYFPESSSLILVSDGGSIDGTLRVAEAIKLPSGIKKVVARYRGPPGKGTAVKAIMEASMKLNVKAMVMVDSDLRSIRPEWIGLLLGSVLEGTDLVAPLYLRDKYDGTITKHLCYPFTKGVYGKDVRQPIGGDFALSGRFIGDLLKNPLWENPYVQRFGVDVFITHSAIASGRKVKQAFLGSKLHEPKDPALHLEGMFLQVSGSMLECAREYQKYWRKVKKSLRPPIIMGKFSFPRPEPIQVNLKLQKRKFKETLRKNVVFLKKLLPRGDLRKVKGLSLRDEDWARIVYTLTANYAKADPKLKECALKALYTAWLGKVIYFIKEVWSLSNEEA